MKTAQIAGGIVAVALLAAGAYWFMGQRGAGGGGQGDIAVATPLGITVQAVGAGRNLQEVYADAKGMTLYTYDKDMVPGKSACDGDCAKAWPPAIAPANARASGDWSVIGRDDGAKQWALKGKPLYGFGKDAKVGDANGGKSAGNPWHVASFKPAAGLTLPDGVMVREVVNAGGQAFTDDQGMPLYTFDGDAVHDKTACTAGPCTNHWIPFVAAQLAKPIGDFTVVARDDGISQWAYKGKALYTFDGDTEPGDAIGTGVDKRWQVALMLRYFAPPNVVVRHNHFGGYNLATTAGMTIYQRERFRSVNGGHSLRTGTKGNPGVGRLLGEGACDAECLKTWHPLTAPADAQPSGQWDVVARADGAKQWAYQGYALYTFAGDTKPGDMNGNDLYDYVGRYVGVSDPFAVAERGPTVLAGPGQVGGQSAMGAPAMFWHATLP